MQQARYRPRSAGYQRHARTPLQALRLLGMLAGELAGLAAMTLALGSGLWMAAGYLP